MIDPAIVEIDEAFEGGHKTGTERLNKLRRGYNAIVRFIKKQDSGLVTVALSIQGQPGQVKLVAPEGPASLIAPPPES